MFEVCFGGVAAIAGTLGWRWIMELQEIGASTRQFLNVSCQRCRSGTTSDLFLQVSHGTE